jgi:hypothetical protein
VNHRERFIAALTFGKPDRIPFTPGGGRESTHARWKAEGLPDGVGAVAYAAEQIGLPDEALDRRRHDHLPFNFRMIPQFEEKLIERRARSQVVQDWKGNICEIGLEYDTSYLNRTADFVTRSWIKCPVESREDWADMQRRYDLEAPGRLPEDFEARAAKLRDRDWPTALVVTGPFWQLREWLGFEGLCMLLLDDPAFADEMIAFWSDFVAAMFERIFAHYVPDHVMVQEDMAYKEKPMVGPDQSRRFLASTWQRWAKLSREAGVAVFDIDSDGYVDHLIPVWIECGANCNSPLEVAAGNDLPAYRQRYGEQMAYRGGVDKRAMAAGGKVIEAEIERLVPVINAGGYIPGCDHAIPSDVSLPNYVHYCRLLAERTGWL